MKKVILFFGLMFLWFGCRTDDPLVATWKIAQVSYTPSGLAPPEAMEQGMMWEEMSSSLRNSTFALFEENKSAFFSTRTPFRQGSWSTTGKRLMLSLGEGTHSYEFEIFEMDQNNLILILIDDSLTDGELTIICKKSSQYSHDGVDLLAPEFNTWREKANKKESKEEIKSRVVAHLDYLIIYFEGIEDKKQMYFETGLVSSPFKFYSHGLGLSRDSKYALQWQDSFYDEADAQVAYNLLKGSLRSIKKFPKSVTFTKEYLLAFQQMRNYFDQ